MAVVTAKQLKNSSGEVLRRVTAGERVVVTKRGKPVAVMVPAGSVLPPEDLRTDDEFWSEIRAKLARSKSAFSSWEDAIRTTRSRP